MSHPSVDASPPTWAGDRLRLGQTNVGFWVLVAAGVIAVRPDIALDRPAAFVGWAGLVAVHVALQAPFDLLGGVVLPDRHGRTTTSRSDWVRTWLRGIAVHGGTMVALGWLALAVHPVFGTGGVVGGWVLAASALLAAQGPLTAWISGRAAHPPTEPQAIVLGEAGLDADAVRVLDAPQPAFVGGWVGLPGLERLLVPASWFALPPHLAAVLLRRRALALSTGSRARGTLAAGAFQLAGVIAVLAAVPGAGFDSLGAVWVTSAGTTLWGFVGLLTLPSLSRASVVHLDRLVTLELGAVAVTAAIDRADRDQEDEPERPTWVGTIFHPVPSPHHRVAALRTAPAADAHPMWRVARTSLVLGWTTGSWLTRSVHCNAGRPTLWALPPGD